MNYRDKLTLQAPPSTNLSLGQRALNGPRRTETIGDAIQNVASTRLRRRQGGGFIPIPLSAHVRFHERLHAQHARAREHPKGGAIPAHLKRQHKESSSLPSHASKQWHRSEGNPELTLNLPSHKLQKRTKRAGPSCFAL